MVDITWKDGELSYLRLHSQLGGVARLRVHTALEKTDLLAVANGDNPNPFFSVPVTKTPRIASGLTAQRSVVREGYLWDVATKAGEEYEFHRAK